MKLFRIVALCLALLASRTFAQNPSDDPKAGTLVDCGSDKVAIFENTESKDGRFALGWTLRPNGKKPAVDWSGYDRNEPYKMIERYPADDENGKSGDYLLLNGVLDLTTKKFTVLTDDDGYFPGRNHHGLSVAWSGNRQGPRYAVVTNDGRFASANLWLVEIGSGGTHATDLLTTVNDAVSARMRKRDPKDYKDYETTYEPGDAAVPSSAGRTQFKKDSVTVHFETGVPKSEVNNDAGTITFALPKGTVLNVAFDKK